MAGTVSVRWTLVPAHAPRPWRHCPTCATTRAFASSGKIRLNANGRKLDAWLIYRCTLCDQTWNRTLFERRPVQQVSRDDLDALQHAAPACVQRYEQDVAALRHETNRVDLSATVQVTKPVRPRGFVLPPTVHLALAVPHPTGCRLDRLLARELALSRTQLQAWVKAGALIVEGEGAKAFRRPLVRACLVILQTGDRPGAGRDALSVGLFA